MSCHVLKQLKKLYHLMCICNSLDARLVPLLAAGTGSEGPGVSDEALPAIRAYLHQASALPALPAECVCMHCTYSRLVLAFSDCNNRAISFSSIAMLMKKCEGVVAYDDLHSLQLQVDIG